MKINYKKLRELREGANLTQKALSLKCNFPWTTYRDWENGNNNPALEDVLNICEVLNINISNLTEDKKTISSLLKQASLLGKINIEPDNKEVKRFLKMFDLLYKKDPERAEKAIEKASKVLIDDF